MVYLTLTIGIVIVASLLMALAERYRRAQTTPNLAREQVAGEVSLGTTSHIEGIVLCMTAITLNNGVSVMTENVALERKGGNERKTNK